jgi:3-dehydroquinate synthase
MNENEVQRLLCLLNKLGLPTSVSLDKQKAYSYMLKDKKKEMSSIHFILMEGIGSAKVELLSTKRLHDHFNEMEASL